MPETAFWSREAKVERAVGFSLYYLFLFLLHSPLNSTQLALSLIADFKVTFSLQLIMPSLKGKSKKIGGKFGLLHLLPQVHSDTSFLSVLNF